MEAAVPIRPTFPLRVVAAAAWAAGPTTPKMGRSFSADSSVSALAETVPQAIMMALGSKERKKATSCRA